jgi:hypothetical protein
MVCGSNAPKRRPLADAHRLPTFRAGAFRAGAVARGRFGDPQMRAVDRAMHKKSVLWKLRNDASQWLPPVAASGAGLGPKMIRL